MPRSSLLSFCLVLSVFLFASVCLGAEARKDANAHVEAGIRLAEKGEYAKALSKGQVPRHLSGLIDECLSSGQQTGKFMSLTSQNFNNFLSDEQKQELSTLQLQIEQNAQNCPRVTSC